MRGERERGGTRTRPSNKYRGGMLATLYGNTAGEGGLMGEVMGRLKGRLCDASSSTFNCIDKYQEEGM